MITIRLKAHRNKRDTRTHEVPRGAAWPCNERPNCTILDDLAHLSI